MHGTTIKIVTLCTDYPYISFTTDYHRWLAILFIREIPVSELDPVTSPWFYSATSTHFGDVPLRAHFVHTDLFHSSYHVQVTVQCHIQGHFFQCYPPPQCVTRHSAACDGIDAIRDEVTGRLA